MIDAHFLEYALRYLLVPGQALSAHEVLDNVGLPRPLPPTVHALLDQSDALQHTHLILTETDPVMMQWNPFSGSTPLYTKGALGTQLLGSHRWLQEIHEGSTKVLYHVIHECVHAIWAAYALQGLLTYLPYHERSRFHAFVEANAVLVGDIEAHQCLLDHGYFDHFWPSSIEQTHAASFSTLRSLEAAKLIKETRAQWLFDVYLGDQRSLPHIPDHTGLRAEAFAFLHEEVSYADKISTYTNPNWTRYYWDREEIESFLEDFVPPSSLSHPDLPTPVSTLDECIQHWSTLLLRPMTQSDGEQAYQRLRLTLQRFALKICELIGVYTSYRLHLSDDDRHASLEVVRSSREKLLSLFRQYFISPTGVLTPEQEGTLADQLKTQREVFMLQLQEICGPVLLLDHPHLDQLPFQDIAPPLQCHTKEGTRSDGELNEVLRLVCRESKAVYQHLKGSSRYQKEQTSAERVYTEACAFEAVLSLEPHSTQTEQIEAWLYSLKQQRILWLPLPLTWLSHCPFIDPLIGFRYR